MKCASKRVGLSFICEKAPAKQPTMHRGTRGSRSVSDYDSKSIPIPRASIERNLMCAILQASPLEKLSQEPLATIQQKDACIFLIWVSSKAEVIYDLFVDKPRGGVGGC